MIKNTDARTFSRNHLAQILAISPDMYVTEWLLRGGKAEFVVDIPGADKKFHHGPLSYE